MLELTQNQAALGGLLIGLLFFISTCSMICVFAVYRLEVKMTAMDLSTHTIEYRDPHGLYDDELNLVRDSDGVVRQDSSEQEEPQDLDKLNEFIDKEGLII